MAIFNSNDKGHKNSKQDSNTTIITAGSSIKGEMNLSCNLYVDGDFDGLINSKKEINVGRNGYIKGDIVAQRLIVQGLIEGSVNAQKVEIKSTGKVKGTIESAELIIESKAVFEGNSILKDTVPKVIETKENPQINKPK